MKVVAQIKNPEVPEGSLRVAFASTDGETVNDHFGWAKEFLLFDVSSKSYLKSGKIAFSGKELDEKGNDDKLLEKIDALGDCHIVYSAAIGGPAAARLTRKKIQPLVVKDEAVIKNLLEELRNVLGGTPPPWINKLLRGNDPSRFDKFDEDDDDDE
ncbi:MAG: nitrogen fixation protein NifX [Nitrospinae bacterium]|nr:nitrogen fixation protein NifX [Nitrospinota bacterium]